MIVVKLEMWPNGDESRAREIARAFIANDAETSLATGGEYGSYDARFMQSAQFDPGKVWKRGKAQHIHRKRRGAWDILYVCLRSAGLEQRNPSKPEKEDAT